MDSRKKGVRELKVVHKKYTYKDGKRFGPYYYETKRVDGQVVTTYLGNKIPHKKIHLSLIKNILLLFAFVLFIASVYFISSTITGNVSLDIKTNYDFGEQIAGKLELNILEGELVPVDTLVLVNYGNYSKEFLLSELVSNQKIEGTFYAQGTGISGNGLGYGLPGKVIDYPTLNFEFYVIEESSENNNVDEDGQESSAVENSGPENSDSNVESSQSSEQPSENSEGESSDSSSSESSNDVASITGAVISNSNIISGTVSKNNDFNYELNSGEEASLVEGSIYHGSENLEDSVVDFEVTNNRVLVSTDYSVESEGFGEDYIGDKSILILLDIGSLGIIASEEAEFSISLVYDDKIIVESSEDISISGDIPLVENEPSSQGAVSFNESINQTIVNETFVNETISNQTQIENVTEINQTIINDTLIEVETIQYGAVIGKPVRWVKTVSVESNDSLNLTIEIPASAENVTVNKISDDLVEEIEVFEEFSDEADVVVGITGEVTADIDLNRDSFFKKILRLFSITGRVVEEETEIQEISVEVLENESAIEVEYYTGAPVALEEIVHDNFKKVLVSSPEDVHYENVLVYTSIQDSSKIKDISSVKIEWVENSSVINISYYNDTNFDGYIDYIEWVAPHLSNQTFNIILIISALHLDTNRSFISDIYNETRELDSVWSETIPSGDYVRITFEINLTNINDITIFPRASDGTNISDVVIEVYEKDSNVSIAQFSNIFENEYNKVFLTNLVGSQDTFDLLISGGNLEFDHIIDPTVRLNGPAGDVDIIPINNVTYVIGWINNTGNTTQFSVMNPNGTVVVPPVTVQTNVGVFSRVSLAPINQTHFAIGWVNQSSADELNAIYNVNGTRMTQPQFWDGAIGNNRYDVGLTQIGNRYGYCYVDQAEGDVDFAASFNNGTRFFAGHRESDIDTGSTPERNRGNLVDCAAINSTTFGVVWYDAGGTDDVLIRFLNATGTNITNGPIRNIDSAVGTSAAVAMSALDFNRTVVAFYDNADQDITITILGSDNSTYLAATDVETAAGTASSIEVVAVRNDTRDYFVVIWYNKSSEDIVARTYRGDSTALTGQFRIEDVPQTYDGGSLSSNSTFPLFAAAGKDSGSGNSLCPGGFVVSYTNITNSSIIKSYWLNGTEWDGACGSSTPLVYPIFGEFNETTLNNSAYVSGAIYRFNITITDSNGTAGIEFNGTNRSASNLTSTMFNTTRLDLAAGTYSYYWWSYGASSAYNISTVRNYVVARNSTPILNLTFNGTQSNVYILNNTNIFVNGSLILGDSTATLGLYKNGTQINQGTVQVSNATDFNTLFGIYNMTVNYEQSQNYTQGSMTYNVTVLPGPYKNISLNDFPDNVSGTGTTFDLIYDITDGAEIAIVQVVSSGGGIENIVPTNVVIDGQDAIRVGSGVYNPASDVNSEIYYLVSPSIGDGLRITANLPAFGASILNIAAFTLKGINLTNPLENYNYTNSSVWNVTTNIQTSAYRSWLVDALALASNAGTPESGINVTMDLDGSLSLGGFKENVLPGLNSMTWNWGTGAQQTAHIVASFRPSFDVDMTSPRIVLNAPANNSFYNMTDIVNFNWTAIDNRDLSMLCNLTIGSSVNKSNIVSQNNTATNESVAGFSVGNHLWNVTCYDDSTNVGFNGTRRFTVLNLIPYNGSAVVLNSTRGTNKTVDDLNVATTLLDLNNHGMNVTVRWYNNSILHLTQMFNSSYSNGSTFIATLGNGNTTNHHNWTANITISDGFNITRHFASNNLTILDSPPNATLVSPLNNSVVNHTQQNYSWVMWDDDVPEFVAVLGMNFSSLAISNCNDPFFNGSTLHIIPTITSYYFTHPIMLECPLYLWSVVPYSTVLGDWASYFRVNVTGNIPNITLNAPENNTVFYLGDTVTFNWTTFDNNSTFSATSTCNLTINDAINKTNLNSSNYINPPNHVSNNVTSSGFSVGTYSWNMTCLDFVGNSNFSQTREFTFISLNDAPYNGTALIINSTLGTNRTLEDLNVRTTLLDQDNNTMNVTVRWYNNSILHLTQMFNSSYSNGSTFIATLGNGNTTKGQNWSANLTIHDGSSIFSVISGNLTILNSQPNTTLSTPLNGSITLNRSTQVFTWGVTDDDGDGTVTSDYWSKINISLVASSTCTDSRYNGATTYEMVAGTTSLADIGFPLNCLIDNGDYYKWSVASSEDSGATYGPYTNLSDLSLQAYLNFVMNISSVEFGNLAYLNFNDTRDNSPKPIIIINEGNVKANATLGASNLWKSVDNPSIYYTAKVDNATTNGISENGTFLASSSAISYINVPLASSPSSLVSSFNYTDSVDTIEVDLNVTVPSTEGPGLKNSTITFTFVLSHQEIYV